MNVLNRFLKYISFDTTSNPNSGLHPSSAKEFDLIDYLEKEMKEEGIQNIVRSKYSYIYGLIPSNAKGYKKIGFIAHVDTSCDASGANIHPQMHANYDGCDVQLNDNCVMTVKEFPFLSDLKGKTLITTDGTTLLGGDDKAGIASIMELASILKNDSSIKHGDIYVAFTPDEEIGEGTMFFELDKFGAEFAYTVDGGKEGEINYENFNAASCNVTIHGINIHPGSAKGHMVNSLLIAQEFNGLLDPAKTPAHTEKYEGFNHLNNMEGNVELTKMHYIIRNHNMDLFNNQKNEFIQIQDFINKKYGEGTCEVAIQDSYFNMYEIIKNHMEIIDIAVEATKQADVQPVINPVRGGTDGASLTHKGLPCPNLGTGGFNCHGRYECITKEGLEKVVQILMNITQLVK